MSINWRPYYYDSKGKLVRNPSVKQKPLNYGRSSSKRQVRITTRSSVSRCKPMRESSIWAKEVQVIVDGDPKQNLVYSVSNFGMNRRRSQEAFQQFFQHCNQEFKPAEKFRFAFNSNGKVVKSLQEIPSSHPYVILSSSATVRNGTEETQVSFHRSTNESMLNNSRIKGLKSRKALSQYVQTEPDRPYRRKTRTRRQPRHLLLQNLKVKLGQAALKIDKDFPKLTAQKVLKLSQVFKFTQAEIYKLNAQYKTMLMVSAVDQKEFSITRGISKRSFVEILMLVNNQKEGKLLLQKIFDSLDSNKDGYLSWREFLSGMSVIKFGNSSQKIDLFYYIYDTDGNNSLSYDEIKELCGLQLYFADQDEILESLTVSFANLIFKMTKVPKSEQISKEQLKQLLNNAQDKPLVDMFCSFSFINN